MNNTPTRSSPTRNIAIYYVDNLYVCSLLETKTSYNNYWIYFYRHKDITCCKMKKVYTKSMNIIYKYSFMLIYWLLIFTNDLFNHTKHSPSVNVLPQGYALYKIIPLLF